LDPTRQRLVLDAGSRDKVRVGQSVIDAGGLLGQITGITPLHASVLLITDPSHAVPVAVARNGVRLVVYGEGRSDSLMLRSVPLSSDVRVGDVLVTSGLGGRFPPGFPVGTITALRPDDSRAFLVGEVKPAAQLDRGREVLVLLSIPPPPADTNQFDTQPAMPEGPSASSPAAQAAVERALAGRRIAIARDAALCFLYPANLDLLRAAGAELAFFSPIAGDGLPECDAVWLPGGYPELHLAALSANRGLRDALHAHVDAGKPVLAECGGLLYALDSLQDRDGASAAMAGLLRGSATIQPRLAALGMQAVTLAEGELRGHTFHYARAEIQAEAIADSTNPNGGPSREAVYRRQRLTAS
ncbi:rod shape-determining protein MreC, partial [Lysobacter sp. 2RAB21]